jgi:hypothetical protein
MIIIIYTWKRERERSNFFLQCHYYEKEEERRQRKKLKKI